MMVIFRDGLVNSVAYACIVNKSLSVHVTRAGNSWQSAPVLGKS
jgi:hypothetical protein